MFTTSFAATSLTSRVVLSVSDMTELGLKITGATGEAKLKVFINPSLA